MKGSFKSKLDFVRGYFKGFCDALFERNESGDVSESKDSHTSANKEKYKIDLMFMCWLTGLITVPILKVMIYCAKAMLCFIMN
jgi:hypothetical protein